MKEPWKGMLLPHKVLHCILLLIGGLLISSLSLLVWQGAYPEFIIPLILCVSVRTEVICRAPAPHGNQTF